MQPRPVQQDVDEMMDVARSWARIKNPDHKKRTYNMIMRLSGQDKRMPVGE